jgi:hypothetical protein
VRAWRAGLAGIVLGWLWGCADGGAFDCGDDVQCIDGPRLGTCHASGYCAFPDAACDSGLRFGEFGPEDLAKSCVPVDAGTGGTTTSAGGSTDSADDQPPPPATTTGADTVGIDDSGGDTTSGPIDTATDTAAETTGEPMRPDPVTLSFGEGDDDDVNGVTRDAFVSAAAPDTNWGTHADLHFGENGAVVAVLAFDVSAIPAGSTAVEATLELVTEAGAAEMDGTVTAYAILEAWEPGDENANPGAVNWTMRTATEDWTNPGVGVGSHDPAPLSSINPYEDETAYSIEIPAALVQAWIDDPSQNHGVVLHSQGISNTGWFYSMEIWDPARRPSLSVTYVPAEP